MTTPIEEETVQDIINLVEGEGEDEEEFDDANQAE
jgi:hypothetical protein